MQINEILAQFGLVNKEDEVYLACLELGLSGVNEIAIKANIKRTTTYDVLSSLETKGLIGQAVKGKKRLFYAEAPEKLNQLLEEKQKKLAEIMPMLKSLHNTAGEKPKIKYYESKEGLKKVYLETLEEGGEIIGFVTENVIPHLGEDFVNFYIKKRVEKNITNRAIAPSTKDVLEYAEKNQEQLRNFRIVPAESFPFSIEMNICGDKIFFVSFKESMGVIIESKEIAKNMKLLFELAWLGAKEFSNQKV